MKNILFLGPYHQYDGWGEAAKDYLRALQLTEHNIVARPVTMSANRKHTLEFSELTAKQLDSPPDVIIQNVLPHLLDYQPNMHNIGLFYIETNHLQHTGWITQINLLDEAWVASNKERDILVQCGVTIPIRVIPMPINTKELDRDVDPFQLPCNDNDFIFYFIGEYVSRKNIMALVMAFNREFYTTENAHLLLKLNKSNVAPDAVRDLIQETIGAFKKNLRLYKTVKGYKPEFTITKHLSMEELSSLHKRCNCFVSASRGESLSRPVMDAAYFGNDIIVTDNTGMSDIGRQFGYTVSSHETPAYAPDAPLDTLYTAHETWQEIDVISLQVAMREAYNNRNNLTSKERLLRGDIVAEQYSYNNIAQLMKQYL